MLSVNHMEDDFVISCHETQKGAKWLDGKDKLSKCSVCESIHPREFMYQILNGGFIRGWLWENDTPVFCETDGGLFRSAHLLDMSEDWLFANAYEIFEKTGVAFYWEAEHIHTWAPFRGVYFGFGSSAALSDEMLARARKLIDDKHYQRKPI